MQNFMNWLGAGLQTPGSVVSVSFKILLVLVLVWLVWTLLENV
jgi:hypothetical protein